MEIFITLWFFLLTHTANHSILYIVKQITKELDMVVQTTGKHIDNAESPVFIVIDNETWIEINFDNGEFKIETFQHTVAVVERMVTD
jgi:hypothetical protein